MSAKRVLIVANGGNGDGGAEGSALAHKKARSLAGHAGQKTEMST